MSLRPHLRPETWKKLTMLAAAGLIYIAEEVIPGPDVRAPGEQKKTGTKSPGTKRQPAAKRATRVNG